MEDRTADEIVIFAGPTVSRREIESAIDATVCGPAKRGDVYLAAKRRPRAIAIIDGTFDQTPAVWHKEILWALSLGIEVFGSSSMGALRAAELSAFGMSGVGEIFEAFASGDLTKDDHVVVAHADEETGFRALSEAFVNLRWSLRAAEKGGVLGRGTRERMEEAADRTFYADRSFPRLLQDARRIGVDREELAAFESWLVGGAIDQKEADARTLLKRLGQLTRT